MATKKTPATKRATKSKKAPASKRAKSEVRETTPAPAGNGWTLEIGQTIEKTYRGKTLRLSVVEGGYEIDGTVHRTLSAAAKAVTGAKTISGPLFFGLAKRKPKVTQ